MYIKIIFLGLMVAQASFQLIRVSYRKWGDHSYYGLGTEIKYLKLRQFEYRNFSKFTEAYLEIKNSSVPTLNPNYFDSKLIGFYLSNANISHILKPFQQTLLQELNLSKNNISELSDDVFESTTRLKFLDVSYNNIRNVSPNIFKDLSNLTTLSLDHNKFTAFHPDTFKNGVSLIFIDLSFNEIECLIKDYFIELKQLKDIYFSNNKIVLLDDNLFEHQKTSLNIIDLSSNYLKNINCTVCGLIRLTHLNLKNNSLDNLDSKNFKNLTSLTYLNLASNNLLSLPTNVFSECPNLIEIFLQENFITQLDKDIFIAQNSTLQTLNLSVNSIKDVTVLNLHKLTNLYLTCNSLTSIGDDTFKNLSSLTSLDISNNEIKNVSKHAFYHLKNLQYLYLRNNNILNLPNAIFQSQKESLIEVDLTSNNLTQIHTAFRETLQIRTILLQFNNISKISHDAFRNLVYLEKLDISHNQMKEFKFGLFDHAINLKYLNFSYNYFESFPLEYLIPLVNLRELYFNNNKITSINTKNIIQHFPMLHKINIGGIFEWSCKKLSETALEFLEGDVQVIEGEHFDGENIKGMKCRKDDLKDESATNVTEIMEKVKKLLESMEKQPKFLNSDEANTTRNSAFVTMNLVINIIDLCLILLIFALFAFVQRRPSKGITAEDRLELI